MESARNDVNDTGVNRTNVMASHRDSAHEQAILSSGGLANFTFDNNSKR